MTNRIRPSAPLGASLVVLSSFFYASYGIWTKLMGNFFEGYTASALRSIIILVMLVPLAVVYRKLEPINWKQNWKHLLGMLAASLFIWGPFYYSILHAGIGISLTINYASYVIGVFFFGWLLVQERLTRSKLLAAVLGILGIGLVFSPSISGIGWLALIAALVSGFGSAANMVIAKQVHYNATQATIALWSASVIGNSIMAPIFREAYPAFGWHVEWLYLVGFAAASVIASWTLIRGMKLIDAGGAGILGLLEIVFGVLFGVLFFHERPDIIALAGIVTIIAAAAIPYIKEYNTQKGTVS